MDRFDRAVDIESRGCMDTSWHYDDEGEHNEVQQHLYADPGVPEAAPEPGCTSREPGCTKNPQTLRHAK